MHLSLSSPTPTYPLSSPVAMGSAAAVTGLSAAGLAAAGLAAVGLAKVGSAAVGGLAKVGSATACSAAVALGLVALGSVGLVALGSAAAAMDLVALVAVLEASHMILHARVDSGAAPDRVARAPRGAGASRKHGCARPTARASLPAPPP